MCAKAKLDCIHVIWSFSPVVHHRFVAPQSACTQCDPNANIAPVSKEQASHIACPYERIITPSVKYQVSTH